MQLRAAEQAWLASGQRQPLFGPGSVGAGAGGTPEQQLAAAAAAYRATGQELPSSRDGGGGAPSLTAADTLRLAVGGAVLDYILADLERTARGAGVPASAGSSSSDGGGGGRGGGEEAREEARRALAALRRTDPELDSIRGGARALLRYFVTRGGCWGCGCCPGC